MWCRLQCAKAASSASSTECEKWWRRVEVPRRVTTAEYWLLDLVVLHAVPVHILTASNLGEMVNRRKTHELEVDQLTETLFVLFRSGNLEGTLERGSRIC